MIWNQLKGYGYTFLLACTMLLRILYASASLRETFSSMGCEEERAMVGVKAQIQQGQNFPNREVDIFERWILSKYDSYPYYRFSTKSYSLVFSAFLSKEIQSNFAQQSSVEVVLRGKMICFWPWKVKPFSFDAYLLSKWLFWEIKKVSSIDVVSTSVSIHRGLDFFPSKISQNPIKWEKSDQLWSILQWILYGETAGFSKETKEIFLKSGLIHLVSASGGNIAMVMTMTFVIFFFVPLVYRRWVGLRFVIVYFFYIWENVAFLRAFLAFCFFFLMKPFARPVVSKRVFYLVLYCIVLRNPILAISSWGLWLSCGGVRGLIHIPIQIQKNRVLRVFAPSVFAFVSLLWPLFFLVWYVNVYSPLLSIIAAPLVSVAICLFVIAQMPLVAEFAFVGLGYVLQWLYVVAQYWADYGLFLHFVTENKTSSFIFRITSRILLAIYYIYQKKRYFERD